MSGIPYHRRIQLAFLLYIFLPIVAVSVVSYMMIKESMIEKVQLSNENFMNVITDEISRTIDDISFSSYYVVNDPRFRNYLKQISNIEKLGSFEDFEAFRNINEDLSLISAKTLNNNVRMYLVNNEGFIFTPNEGVQYIQANLDKLMQQINRNEPESLQWLGIVEDKHNSNYFIGRVIYDVSHQEMVSVLLISIAKSYFEGLLKPVQFGKVALFDAHGTPITNVDQLERHVGDTATAGLRSEMKIEKTNWTLVYEASQATLTGQISKTFYTGLAGVSILFIVFLISSMYIAKRLYTPIQKLQRVVRQFGMGNLDMRLDISGKDDIAETSKSINTMLDQLKGLIADIEQEQEQKKVMELEALFMQIRPHFLINTLNSVKCSLMLQNDQLHSGVLDSLMSLLRAYLKVNEPVTLQEECKLLRHYVEIMQIRNEMLLRFEINLEPGTENFIIPKLILQPLLENVIVHGLVDVADAQVIVRAKRDTNDIIIEIEDNGEGMEAEALHALNHYLQHGDAGQYASYERVGLINVVRRLQLTFGPSAILQLNSNQYGGITVYVCIPLQDKDKPASLEVTEQL